MATRKATARKTPQAAGAPAATTRAAGRKAATGARGAREALRIKVTLRGVRPPVWRRILVPADATFWDLHVALQDAMGWTDSHLHAFRIGQRHTPGGIDIGIPVDDQFAPVRTLPGWEVPVARHLREAGSKCVYEYDFGDGWEHDVVLEARETVAARTELPACLAGKRACPPEDCGGPWGYAHLLAVLGDPDHEEHDDLRQWAGDELDPAAFTPGDVLFNDPRRRLRHVLRR